MIPLEDDVEGVLNGNLSSVFLFLPSPSGSSSSFFFSNNGIAQPETNMDGVLAFRVEWTTLVKEFFKLFPSLLGVGLLPWTLQEGSYRLPGWRLRECPELPL